MKNTHILTGALWLFSQVALAQIPSVTQTRVITERGPMLAVSNDASSPIVALHLSFACPDGSKVPVEGPGIFDNLFNYGKDYPINPGQSYSFRMAKYKNVECDGAVDAILYADGTTVGDTAAVQAIYLRRKGVYSAIQTVVPQLRLAARGTQSTEAVIKLLQTQSDSALHEPTLSINEKMGKLKVFASVIVSLRTQADMGTPSDRSRQPIRTDKLMTELGIPRQQANAMAMSKKLLEWSSDLEGKLSFQSTN